MKYIFGTISILLISSSLFGQAKLVKTEESFDLVAAQKVTNFVIHHKKKDAFISNCLKEWGDPFENTYGIIKWSKVDIAEIRNGVAIKLQDGYTTKTNFGNLKSYATFKSAEEKESILKKREKGKQERLLSIILYDQLGENLILNENETKQMKAYLAGLFAD